MKIAVLAGGDSPEREVSLTSGSLIAKALQKRGHKVLLLDVYEGISVLPKNLNTLFRGASFLEERRCAVSGLPDLETLRKRCNNGRALIGKNVIPVCQSADLVFLALHGAMGENGMLQALLAAYGIPFTGSDYIGSLLAMDKDLAKRLFKDAGIPTPHWQLLGEGDSIISIKPPCVVKPCSGGSSVGMSMVQEADALMDALQAAKQYGEHALIEERIVGRELTVGILNGKALPVVEIVPPDGYYYDYENKYSGRTAEICPAELSRKQTEQIQSLALRAFAALRLKDYARIDFLMDEMGAFWCLEANTLPGMTETSLFPLAASKAGIPYELLCEQMLWGAMQEMRRHR